MLPAASNMMNPKKVPESPAIARIAANKKPPSLFQDSVMSNQRGKRNCSNNFSKFLLANRLFEAKRGIKRRPSCKKDEEFELLLSYKSPE